VAYLINLFLFLVHSYTTYCSFGEWAQLTFFLNGFGLAYLAATGYLMHTDMYLSLYYSLFSDQTLATSGLLSHKSKTRLTVRKGTFRNMFSREYFSSFACHFRAPLRLQASWNFSKGALPTHDFSRCSQLAAQQNVDAIESSNSDSFGAAS
jgi:hypothetical protein